MELDTHRTTMAFRGVVATGDAETRTGPVGTVRFAGLPAREKDVEIWLPHYERTELVALRTDAPVEPVPPGPGRPVWLHHGSSISQGSNAASPTTTWPALAAAHGDVELVNLGFSGSAMLDPFIADAAGDPSGARPQRGAAGGRGPAPAPARRSRALR